MLKRHKSRRDRAIDIVTKYLKLKAAGKAAKGAAKAARWTTYGKIAKTAAERAPKKGLLAVAGGVGTAAAVAAARKRRSATPTTA
jgi:hypothetical protein